MRRLSEFDLPGGGEPAPDAFTGETIAAEPLSSGSKGFAGVIVAVRAPDEAGGDLAGGSRTGASRTGGSRTGGLGAAEIERRLVEMGFVEDAPVEIIHEGLFGRDPIAIRLADRTVALRRREARAVLVRPSEPSAKPAARR